MAAAAGAMLAIFCTCTSIVSPATAETLRVHGSTTFNRALIEPFEKIIEEMSGHRLQIIPNKSTNGVIDLLEGRADIAMISAPLAGEITRIGQLRPDLKTAGLESHLMAETRVAFVVHPGNSVVKASIADLAKVLFGEIKSWRELGGADLPIRTVYVRSAGGVTNVVQEVVLDGKNLSPALAIPVDSPVQVAKIVAQEPSAIGLSQMRLAKEYKLNELAVDVPVVQQLILVTKGQPSGAIQSLIRAVKAVADKQLPQAN